jgi:hypothetical protein
VTRSARGGGPGDPEALSGDALEAQLKTWLEAGPVQVCTGWQRWMWSRASKSGSGRLARAHCHRVKNLYRTMRTLYASFDEPGTFLVSATRLGGLHGYGPNGAAAPLGGAVSGFTKAFKRERSQPLVKAVDFEVSRKTAELAEALIAETLGDPGAVEIGPYGRAFHHHPCRTAR